MSESALFEFNTKFEKSLAVLEQTPWLILRLKQLNKLHELLQDSLESSQQQPFKLELDGVAVVLASQIVDGTGVSAGVNPRDIESFYLNFRTGLNPVNTQKLEFLIIENWFSLGASKRVYDFLLQCEWYKLTEDQELPIASVNLLKFQRKFLDRSKAQFPSELQSRLHTCMNIQRHGSSHSQIRGLFVIGDGEQQCGLLADLSLESLKAFKKQGVDQLRIATHLVDEEDILADQGHDLFEWLRSKYSEKIKGHLRLEYTLSEKSSVLSGSSLGLGLGILGQMALYGLDKNRSFEPRIYGDVAITGALDASGQVLPVNETTLKYKLEAAFFSTVSTLVLPALHQQVAETFVAELYAEYPLRHLNLVYISHIDELEQHREIFFYQRRKISQRTLQFFREYANFVTLSVLSFIVVLFAGFWFGIVKHPVPFKTALRDKEIVVQNKFGLTLWKGGPASRSGVIADILNDTIPEVIIGYDKHAPSNLNGYVVCYNYKGEILWKFKTGAKVHYGDDVIENHFSGRIALVEDLNSDGFKEIITIGVPGQFPNQICLLSNRGNLISEYWHAGHLHDPRSIEIYNDNENREVIFCGINNEYRTGLVLVLDPFKMEGCSPATNPSYNKNDSLLGNELYYLKFPNTHFVIYPKYDISEVLSTNSQGTIRISHSNGVTLSNGEAFQAVVFYLFDSTFTLLSSSPGDNYYYAYKQVFPDREPLVYGDENLIKYFADIDYWDGSGWVKTPTINIRYLQSLLN